MKNFQITISSDKIEAIAKFQNFLDHNADYRLTYGVRIDNDFEETNEYYDYLNK
jgi:hypothetical protein